MTSAVDRANVTRGQITRGQALTSTLLAVAIVAAFTVSSMMLERFGIQYDTVGGGAWQKIHPATFVAVLALTIDIFRKGQPFARLADIVARFPGATLFLAMWMLLLAYSVFVQHVPVSTLIDNYLVVIAALLLYDEIGPTTRLFLRRFLHVVMFVNAAVGFIELIAHVRLTPYVISGVEVLTDYRSTALLGHPLANAGTTGAYILCLLLGGGRSLNGTIRVALLIPQLLAMLAFGGRTSIVLVSGVAALSLLKSMALLLLGKKFDIRGGVALLLAVPILLGAGVISAYAGAFDQLIERFVDDNGSAAARVIMFRLFDIFPIEDLLLGPAPDLVTSSLTTLGISIGIENTWFAWVFQYGALMTLFFSIGFIALCWELWRRARAGAILLFIFFFAIISSATGLASKTYLFAQFGVFVLVLFRSDALLSRAPASPIMASTLKPRR